VPSPLVSIIWVGLADYCFIEERGHITLVGIACIIMREVYGTMGESIYPNQSSLSRDFLQASGRLQGNVN